MQKLITRSYEAIKSRGLITDETTTNQFIDKLQEELSEVKEAYKNGIFLKDKTDPFYAEVVDLINVGINLLKHHDIDFVELFTKCIEKQEYRAIYGK